MNFGRMWKLSAVLLVAAALPAAALVFSGQGHPLTATSLALALSAVMAALLAIRTLRARQALSEQRSRQAMEMAKSQALELHGMRQVVEAARAVEAESAGSSVGTDIALALVGAHLWPDLKGRAIPSELLEGQFETPLSTGRLVNALTHLVDAGQVLLAARLVRLYGVAEALPLRYLRLMARGLRDRGYLRNALEYFALAAKFGQETDRTTLSLREAEIAVLSGQARPTLRRSEPSEPVPGRVLHVVGRALPFTQSGYTLRTQHTCRAQLEAGIDAHVFVQGGTVDDPATGWYEHDTVPYFRASCPSVFKVGHVEWLQANAEALLQTVHELRPAVLHAHSDFLNALIADAVGRVTGVPVIYESRGFWEESLLSRIAHRYRWRDTLHLFEHFGTPEAYSWRRAREAEARAAVDHVITLARVMAERIRSEGVDAEDITLVPNAVDADTFVVDQVDVELREDLGIPSTATVIGCITSVVEYEGLDLLLEAFDKVSGSTDHPTWLLVVGDGPEREALMASAAEKSLDNVTFTGRVAHAEVLRYMSLIDIVAVPRRPTAVSHLVTPLKPFEAFAAGRAVLLSDVDALQEIAEDSQAARLFRAGDVDHFAQQLQYLIATPSERHRLAQKASTWVRSERTWARNAETYLGAYQQVCAGWPARPA